MLEKAVSVESSMSCFVGTWRIRKLKALHMMQAGPVKFQREKDSVGAIF